jgi:hypothetical protein
MGRRRSGPRRPARPSDACSRTGRGRRAPAAARSAEEGFRTPRLV